MAGKKRNPDVERVTRHRQNIVDQGGRRLDMVLLPQDVEHADHLIEARYAPNVAEAVRRALAEAAERNPLDPAMPEIGDIAQNRVAHLKRWREELGSQKALAERTGLRQTHLSAITSGRLGLGDVVARRIEEKLGIPALSLDSSVEIRIGLNG